MRIEKWKSEIEKGARGAASRRGARNAANCNRYSDLQFAFSNFQFSIFFRAIAQEGRGRPASAAPRLYAGTSAALICCSEA